jgi:predicted transcriptional regulator
VRSGKLLSVYLPEELAERLAASAKRHHRTKSVQVILALTAFLDADEAAFSAGTVTGLPAGQDEGQSSQSEEQ